MKEFTIITKVSNFFYLSKPKLGQFGGRNGVWATLRLTPASMLRNIYQCPL